MKTMQIGNILTNLQKAKPPGFSHTPGTEAKPKPGSLPLSQSVSAISTLTLSDELRAKVDRLTSGGLKRSHDDHVKMKKISEVNNLETVDVPVSVTGASKMNKTDDVKDNGGNDVANDKEDADVKMAEDSDKNKPN